MSNELSSLSKFRESLTFTIDKAKKPLVWIESFDYSYIIDLLCGLGSDGWIWNESSGAVCDLKTQEELYVAKQGYLVTDNLSDSIKNIYTYLPYKILVAKVTNMLFRRDCYLIASLQDFVFKNNKRKDEDKQTIVLISNNHIDNLGLEHICERMSMPLPDIEDIDEEFGLIQDAELTTLRDDSKTISPKEDRIIEIGEELRDLVTCEETEKGIFYKLKDEKKQGIIRRNSNGIVERIILPKEGKYKFASGFLIGIKNVTLETRYQSLVEALCGMQLYDIKESLRSVMLKGNGTIRSNFGGETLLSYIRDIKKQIANNSGLLEVVEYEKNYHENVADIDNLMEHIESEKKRIDNPSLYPPKLSKPKGILLVGAPGCGKSESAKAIASKLDKPLYRLNIGNLLGHKYGQSENRFIEALQTADAAAPCVLWIDEIEKAFAGAGNESENDDTLTHIVGHFLTWMQEHKTMVYLVATANDVSRMKPEMLRKGRWDETFYLNYPSSSGCEKIIKTITKKKLGIELKEYEDINITTITDVMCRIPMSGAEIENTIIETIKSNPSKNDKNQWCVSVKDIALTLFDYLKERGMLTEYTDEEKDEKKYQYAKEKLQDFVDNPKKGSNEKSNKKRGGDEKNENKTEDLFLEMKVDKELLDMKIQSFGRISEMYESSLRELLKEKYKNMYSFKPASKNVK